MNQKEIILSGDYKCLDEVFVQYKKVFLVCDNSYGFLRIGEYFDSLINKGIGIVKFTDFEPNPDYVSVKKGVSIYRELGCDAILAVGGGSAIDVAKCIKLYAQMSDDTEYIEQPIIPNEIKLMAVPTTAGTGSEATRYAVIYYNGAKQSVTDESCIPSVVIFDPSVLKTLPEYQRKSTMLDALCHAMESFWSVNSNEESRQLSSQAVHMILDNMNGYLDNLETANIKMMMAANIAGKAINITQTTAGHAMCYKLTSLYNLAHGHAAALCVSQLLPFMVDNTDRCLDERGVEYLKNTFSELAEVMGCSNVKDLGDKFKGIVQELQLPVPTSREEDISVLKSSVNLTRLKNNPVELTEDTLDVLYRKILNI